MPRKPAMKADTAKAQNSDGNSLKKKSIADKEKLFVIVQAERL